MIESPSTHKTADCRMPKSFRALVVSDIHAYDSGVAGHTPPSFFDVASTDDRPEMHPLHGLLKTVERESISADVLICLGDIADKASPHALSQAWDFLDLVKIRLGAELIIATPGNHDMDSRFSYNKFDARGQLLNLKPPYPFSDENERCKFWTYNFAVNDLCDVRVLIINSSAYHGNGSTNSSEEGCEFRHGRIADSTIDNIINRLSGLAPKPIQLAVLHHHIEKIQGVEEDGYSEIKNAYRLMEAFGSGLYGHWILAHGHMHYPTIRYGSGTSDAPAIFSSGSLCSTLYGHFATRVRNQFHYLIIDPDKAQNLRLPVAGLIHSWTWASGLGWQRSMSTDGLPAECGFGYRPNFTELGEQLESAVGPAYAKWSEIVQQDPRLQFIAPMDIQVLINKFSKKIGITFDQYGVPFQVEKK